MISNFLTFKRLKIIDRASGVKIPWVKFSKSQYEVDVFFGLESKFARAPDLDSRTLGIKECVEQNCINVIDNRNSEFGVWIN